MNDTSTVANGQAHRNLEVKARCNDFAAASAAIEQLGAVSGGFLIQVDTYFYSTSGRLKLREIAGAGAQLIAYNRPDDGPERWSEFRVVSVPNAGEMKLILADALGVRGTVSKRRDLYLWNNCRIHLDDVQFLGTFLEFEVCSVGDETDDFTRMAQLKTAFGIRDTDIINVSYAALHAALPPNNNA